MPQNLGNQCRLLDAGYDPQLPTAMGTGLDVDGKNIVLNFDFTDVKIDGSKAKLDEMLSYLDTFEFWFNIVTP
jgi:hypothetical protein